LCEAHAKNFLFKFEEVTSNFLHKWVGIKKVGMWFFLHSNVSPEERTME
jgi:hypothetical protein